MMIDRVKGFMKRAGEVAFTLLLLCGVYWSAAIAHASTDVFEVVMWSVVFGVSLGVVGSRQWRAGYSDGVDMGVRLGRLQKEAEQLRLLRSMTRSAPAKRGRPRARRSP